MIRIETLLMNTPDLELEKYGAIAKSDMKGVPLNMILDNVHYMTRIDNSIQDILQLDFIQKRIYRLHSGDLKEFDLPGPAWLKINNRIEICNPLLDPDCIEPILGKIELVKFNLMFDENAQTLVPDPRNLPGRLRIRHI